MNTSTNEIKTLPCTRLILAAGAWTPSVHRTLFGLSDNKLLITPLAGHSLVLRSPLWPPPKLDTTDKRDTECHAVFTTDSEGGYSPELFSRMPGGLIYLAGLNSSTYPLPEVADQRVIDSNSIEILKRTAGRLLGEGEFEVVREGVCWRPVSGRGGPLPIVKKFKEYETDVIVAAGHGAWGISLSLGTGWCVRQILEGKCVREWGLGN